MRVLLVGGLGYIGAHVYATLHAHGHEPVVLDSLENSTAAMTARLALITGEPVRLCVADASVPADVSYVFAQYGPFDAIIHLAGRKSVAESVQHPLDYWRKNVGSLVTVLTEAEARRVPRFVFSSSATVYGVPLKLPVIEDHPFYQRVSPYGMTKRTGERIMQSLAEAEPTMHLTALRYCNPIGGHPSSLIGEDPTQPPSNLVPVISEVASGKRPHVEVYGTEYDTPDGTALRDYVDVMDVADAHVAALERAPAGFRAYNIGTGDPVSVLEVIEAYRRVSGLPIDTVARPPRDGDVPAFYSDPSRAARELGWIAIRTLEDSIRTAWLWTTAPH